MVTDTISVEDAEDVVWGTPIASQEVSRHRWYTKRLVVFDYARVQTPREVRTMGLYYLEPASEDQEGQDIFEADPVPIFPVVKRQVVTVVWEPADA